MIKRKTIILTRSDVEQLVSIEEAMRIIEKSFRMHALKRVEMPAKIYIHLDEYKGDFRAMPAYIKRPFDCCGLKWVNVHPGNRRFGLPSVMAIFILSDPRNGFPLSVMDATYLTNLRTGAAGGVAAKNLARKDSHIIGILGCGAQAQTQLLALQNNFKIKIVKIFDKNPLSAKRFLKKVSRFRLNIECADTIKKCLEDADIIITTTPSRKPIIRPEWVKRGAHINAIGADAKGKQELEPRLLKRAKIIIDDWRQASHSGEINVPLAKRFLSKKDIHATLGEVLIGKRTGRANDKENTVFDSTGLAIQDVSLASYIYKQAVKKGLGKQINLMGLAVKDG